MSRQASDICALAWIHILCHEIADDNSPALTYCNGIRTTHPCAKSYENGSIYNITHRDIADGHVFEQPPVHGFQCEAPAIIEHAIRNGYVPESAIGFRAEFYSAGGVAIGILLIVPFKAAIQQCSFIVTAHLAIGNGNIIRCPCVSQGERTF